MRSPWGGHLQSDGVVDDSSNCMAVVCVRQMHCTSGLELCIKEHTNLTSVTEKWHVVAVCI